MQVLGVHTDGGLRPQFLVPARKLHPSQSLTFEQLALVETLGIGYHAVERSGLQPGETVLIVGAGPIGLAVLQFALAAGGRVRVLDLNPERRRFAHHCRPICCVPGECECCPAYLSSQTSSMRQPL